VNTPADQPEQILALIFSQPAGPDRFGHHHTSIHPRKIQRGPKHPKPHAPARRVANRQSFKVNALAADLGTDDRHTGTGLEDDDVQILLGVVGQTVFAEGLVAHDTATGDPEAAPVDMHHTGSLSSWWRWWPMVAPAEDHEEDEVDQRGASGAFIGAKQRDVPGAVVGAGLWRSRSRKRSRIVARVEAPGSTNGQASQSSPRCGQVG
jgi:hypothetical protein